MGCRGESQTVAEPTAGRSVVPLRIALVGSDLDAESIRRGWGAVTEQPLDISVIEYDRGDCNTLGDAASAAVEVSDLG